MWRGETMRTRIFKILEGLDFEAFHGALDKIFLDVDFYENTYICKTSDGRLFCIAPLTDVDWDIGNFYVGKDGQALCGEY